MTTKNPKWNPIPPASPEMARMSGAELKTMNSKAAKAELERRKGNKAMKRAVLAAASK
jgi:hypothetical protein